MNQAAAVLDVLRIATTFPRVLVCLVLLPNSVLSYTNCSLDCNVATCNDHGTCNSQGLCKCNSVGLAASTNCSTCLTSYYNFPSCTCMFSSPDNYFPSPSPVVHCFILMVCIQIAMPRQRVEGMERVTPTQDSVNVV